MEVLSFGFHNVVQTNIPPQSENIFKVLFLFSRDSAIVNEQGVDHMEVVIISNIFNVI